MGRFYTKIVGIALISLLFWGCSDSAEEMSGIRMLQQDDFIPRDMHQSEDGRIMIYGFSNKANSYLIRTYDRALNLAGQESIGITDIYPFAEILYHNFMDGLHLFVIINTIDGAGSELRLLEMNENLQVLKDKPFFKNQDPFYGRYSISEFSKSGDNGYLLAMDTTMVLKSGGSSSHMNRGIRIMKLDSDLGLMWEFKGKRSGLLGARVNYRVQAIELADGRVFYHVEDLLPQPISEYISVVGLLSPNGELIYQNTQEAEFYSFRGAGLSRVGDNVLLNLSANNEQIQYYRVYDPLTGTEISERSLPKFYIDRTFPQNRLPIEIPEQGSGLTLYRIDKRQLIFQQVNAQGEPTSHFNIPTPPHEDMGRYTQCFTSEGTVLVAYNLLRNGLPEFYLMEFGMDGVIR
ncbi:MAG: hypothetical protein H6606_04215 [Flavobacteriales bacterium]|nr:hypothetical protein [Flavobacteriales bacterium]